ncbi:HD domain-containing phosphohydrolase [Candidatus Laterigemmans baculatus]|uniref:HD domain-containing phosphohydrolase n=1 Tax=Candidatus Laterigemmans baculatus TaxID=2770505 RepID=UPI001F487077|nr:HD domain-containing phosphohydrolase [Candidatus Laterigemmans baculatus]
MKQSRILIVDDEPLNIAVVQGYLEMEGYQCIRSTDFAVDALPMVEQFRPDLILLDIHMPEVNGLEILKALRADSEFSTIPVVILTATSTDETKLEALQCGATDLLSKPVHQGEMLARIRNVLTVKSYQDRLRGYSEELELAVRKRTAELEASRLEVIQCLARAAEFRDDDTGQHIIRVGRYARIIGEELGLSKDFLEVLEPAAQLHDVGKIGVPDAILLKPGKLTPEEYEVMQKHCGFGKKIVDCLPAREAEIIRNHAELGANILENVRSPILAMAKRIALTHHERWDGTGYPMRLAGSEIPLEGRITAVADVFDALSSKRIYKAEFPLGKCFELLEEGRGTQFDPAVLDAFFARREQIVRVRIELADVDA